VSAPTTPSAAAKRSHAAGLALIVSAALLWSSGGLGIKLVHAHPLAIAGYRGFFAVPVMLLALWFASRAAQPGGRRSGAANVRAALGRPSTWYVAVTYAVVVVLFVAATRLTTAANAILLQYTSPVHIALLSPLLLRERVAWWDWVAIGVAGCGVALLFYSGDGAAGGAALGNVLALVSGVAFGLLGLLLRRERLEAVRRGEVNADVAESPVGALVAVALGNALAALSVSPWMVLHGPADPTSVAVLLGLGIVQIGLSYVLFVAGTARVTAIEAGLASTIEPVLNPLWVAVGYGELPSLGAVAGGALIVVAVLARGLVAGAHARRLRAASGAP
jgi:drug/metabolite transporter (DMT)-like permease